MISDIISKLIDKVLVLHHEEKNDSYIDALHDVLKILITERTKLRNEENCQ